MSTKTKERKLTRKQMAFVKELVENPKQSGTQAVLKTYGKPNKPMTYAAASVQAYDNLRNPKILSVLAEKSEEAEMSVYEVMQKNRALVRRPANGALVLAAAKDILDRVHGKATQRIEATSTSISFTIDLTGISVDSDDSPDTDA